MELTWITIAASLAMGLGAAFLFLYAVKKGWFHNFEDAKYQVFWSDLEELIDRPGEKKPDGSSSKPEKKLERR
jgi:nitrogen fixation-related uncharacterized protein